MIKRAFWRIPWQRIRRKYAFTLLELIVVMAIFTVIAAGVIYAMNIRLSYLKTFDAERGQYARALQQAQMQHLIKNWTLLKEEEIPAGAANAKPICTEGVTTDPTCVNLDALVPDFLVAIPRDRAEPNPNYTGFDVYKEGVGIEVAAEHMGEGAIDQGQLEEMELALDAGEDVFATGPMPWVAVDMLTEDTFVVVYADGWAGWARIGRVTGGSFVWMTAATDFHHGGTLHIDVQALTSTQFVVSFVHVAPDHAAVLVGNYNVGGGTIDWMLGENGFSNTVAEYTSLARLSDTTFLATWVNAGTDSSYSALVGTFDGVNWLTWGTEVSITGAGAGWYFAPIAVLSPTTFLVSYSDATDNDRVKVRVGTVTGDAITWEDAAVLAGGSAVESKYTSITPLDEDSFAVTAGNTVSVGTVIAGEITWDSSPTTFTTGAGTYNDITALDETTLAIAHVRLDQGSQGMMRVGTVLPGTVGWNTPETVINANETGLIDVVGRNAESLVLSYADGATPDAAVLGTNLQPLP